MATTLQVRQLIYSSQPFGFDEAVLAGILLDARRCNTRDGVTGALVCRREVFLQLLEGPEKAVLDTIERIDRDDRHTDMVVHVSETVPGRMFGDWAMLHDPAQSWFGPDTDGPVDWVERVRASDVKEIFRSLASRSKP